MKGLITDLVTFFGRILLALIFVLSGLSKIGDFSGNVSYMQAKGIPLAPFFLFGSIFIELLGSALLITGYRARLGALLLALYLIPVTYLFHALPAMGEVSADQKIQMISMMKNLSILGGLLLVFGNGVGKWSLGKD